MPPDILSYREPFVGGGGIYFGLNCSTVNHRWINDYNPSLIAFYRALQTDTAFIRACRDIRPPQPNERLESTKGTGKEYNARLKSVFDSFKNNDDMDQGLRYFFINRTVWAGRVTYDPKQSSRMYYSNPSGWNIVDRPNYLEEVHQHLQNTKITNLDYSEVINEPGEQVWIYLDPPYCVDTNFSPGSKLYQYGFSAEDHLRFVECCKASKHKLCISYDDNKLVRKWFTGFNIHEYQWKYCGTTQKKKTLGKELVITNY